MMQHNPPQLDFIMKELGYTEGWLTLGVVDPEVLQRQYAEFVNSDDQNPEHYRCRAFIDYLNDKEWLSDEELEALFGLTDDGSDGCDLRKNRIIEILSLAWLTDEQFYGLARFPWIDESPIREKYQRDVVVRRLDLEGLGDDVFQAVIESEDTLLHRALLRRDDLRREHVQWLAENGGNKAVRNQARQKLGSRRFRRK